MSSSQRSDLRDTLASAWYIKMAGNRNMTNEEIANRLRPIRSFVTPEQHVVNRIVRVENAAVVIVSERTQNERTIPFDDIRNRATPHQVAINVLRQILGLD